MATDLITEQLTTMCELAEATPIPNLLFGDDTGLLNAFIERAEAQRWPVRRNVRLARYGSVPLMVGAIVVVPMTWGSPKQAEREAARWAGSKEVDGVLLITTFTDHARVPGLIRGTPVRTALVRSGTRQDAGT